MDRWTGVIGYGYVSVGESQEHQGEINAPGPEADGRDEDPSAKGELTHGL